MTPLDRLYVVAVSGPMHPGGAGGRWYVGWSMGRRRGGCALVLGPVGLLDVVVSVVLVVGRVVLVVVVFVFVVSAAVGPPSCPPGRCAACRGPDSARTPYQRVHGRAQPCSRDCLSPGARFPAPPGRRVSRKYTAVIIVPTPHHSGLRAVFETLGNGSAFHRFGGSTTGFPTGLSTGWG